MPSQPHRIFRAELSRAELSWTRCGWLRHLVGGSPITKTQRPVHQITNPATSAASKIPWELKLNSKFSPSFSNCDHLPRISFQFPFPAKKAKKRKRPTFPTKKRRSPFRRVTQLESSTNLSEPVLTDKLSKFGDFGRKFQIRTRARLR